MPRVGPPTGVRGSCFGDTFNGFSRVYSPSELRNSDLKPEKTNSIELGADVRFFKNRDTQNL